MSHEYDEIEGEESFSAFWPLVVVLGGLLIWSGYQVFAINSQRALYSTQFQNALPAINNARNVESKYFALMKDLAQTSSKDPYAAQIVKEAIQAGWIHINKDDKTGGPSSSTPPTDTPAPAK